ncbi:DEAD-box ATP-dependent RNA helicase 58, chloroplastic isoform X1 [Ipomoea triloba]|uniref:DEAD-box ATP-dependent RNA helicase 58, chloroplastic isoform X1 n=1 Tax=Ipomoea triloba TaxID=35885 RepID=UPI00125D5A60|nr:DEAD-box ATP-dependent RNA helicase 58, chloroplastic isoform X1 [Ipomoea triloba]GMD87034.1 DEAD-box ATP-dependent RNA helicase 58, chloroplastic isoform X1 [Ipomoea batatas]
MACLSATLLNSLSWTARVHGPHHLYPNRPNHTFVVSMNGMVHSMREHTLLKASLSSSYIEVETAKKEGVLTLHELCQGHVPEHIIRRMEEVGYVVPTKVQQEALPVLFAGCDCVLHAQTGSGKTLAYLLRIFSVINTQRSAVQALIVVPTRELGIQVTKVARVLYAKSEELNSGQKSCTIMALLDGGTLKRHKSWLKAEPPTIVIATLGSLTQMLEKNILKLDAMQVLVIDEVDFMFNSSKHVSSLRKLLTSYSCRKSRQTIFASASIPQHRRFLYDAVQQKWTKADVVHLYVNPIMPMPSCLHHRFVVCSKGERYLTLLSLLKSDEPHSAIVFVGVQSEKSKKAGDPPPTTLLVNFLKSSLMGFSEISLLEEDMNFNQRAASLTELQQGSSHLLVATDIAARGVDLPGTTHIYNFNLPKDAVNYLHRAGRAGRKPFSDEKCFVTSIITPQEQFVLQRFENELMFSCEQLFFDV